MTAILDGQQRLTALNIGLYGSHAERIPRGWWTSPDAFPKKRLYIDLRDDSGADELGMVYTLEFLTEKEAKRQDGEPDYWYPVGDVMKLADSGPSIMAELAKRDLIGEEPFRVLYRLFQAVREVPAINAFQEESQDPDKVLDIFVRVNSGGTQLSYSDLLLSMATNQWEELDAREEVRTLVSELNDTSAAFGFSKDIVLKTGLVLIDVPDIGFRVSNFTQSNMSLMEKHWPKIRSALITSVDLLASFGYSGRTLTAASAIIPITYYLNQRGLGHSYVEASTHAADRLKIQRWLTRSLMKRGIWRSGLDSLLSRIRDVIRNHGTEGFPAEEIETAMGAVGKSLRFEDAEISELMDLRFGSPRVFPVLATLYPGLNLTKSFHEDHIFPKSRFTRSKLAKAGIDPENIEEYVVKVDALPKLQLLAGLPNVEKQAMLPAEWLNGPHFPTPEAREAYISQNDLDALAGDLHGFLDFFENRRRRIEERLRRILNAPNNPAGRHDAHDPV